MKFTNLNKYRVGGTDSRPQLAIPLPTTPAGRVYRLSPNENAQPRLFVLGKVAQDFEVTPAARARMKHEPHSNGTVCPYSGLVAPDNAFLHPDDRAAAIEEAKQAMIADVRKQLSETLKRAARGSKSLTYKPGRPARKPRLKFRRDDLLRELVCDHCGRDYGVYAIGLFCPDCGAPNLRLHFARECELVGAQVEIAEAQGEGLGELAYRLLGNAHEDVLTAFEATLKTVYLHGIANRPADAPAVKPVVNDFQNIEKAQKRFKDLDLDPFAGLAEAEQVTLRLNIQKRHVIGHNLGVVDAKFAEHAEEAKLGETVELVAGDIRAFAAICQKIVDHLDEWLCGAPSPTIGANTQAGPTASAPKPKKQITLDDLSLDIGPLAREIGLWLANQSENGLGQLQPGSDLASAFPDASTRDLGKALAELEDEGLVTLSGRGGGRPVPQPFPTSDLYTVFDPIAFGCDPHEDACELIRGMLAEAKEKNLSAYSVSGGELLEKTGWPHRRLNPALSLVIAQIGDGRVSKTLSREFAARAFNVIAADELALERFLKRAGG